MTPKSILEISLSSHGGESFGEVMQEIVAGKEAPPPAPGGRAPAAAPADPDGAKPLFFDRYRTVRELGRGGMGIVWLVHDTVLDIPVALKLVPEAIVHDTEGIVNLKKEVLRGMALAHPGIVRVHGFEQQPDKTAGIVMEFVQGESLAEKKVHQRDLCFDVEEVRPWLDQLCAALDYAHHEARIAHRDLKPGNLLITPTGKLKIVDFGLASSLSETRSRISMRLGISGTPPYMSPQQLMGQRPTHLDDLYSLGATLYELLTGTPPFFRGDIVTQILREPPQPIAARREEFGVRNRSPIPPAWERTIAACLAKEPGARPASAAAILQMLDGAEEASAVEVPSAGAMARPETDGGQDCPHYEPAASSAAPLRADSVTELRLAPVLAPQPELQIQPLPIPPESVQRVYPRPVPPKEARTITLEPVLNAGAYLIRGLAAAIAGLVDLIMSVLSPLLKIAAVIAVLWGLLHLKQKWDAGAAQRQAAAAIPPSYVLPPAAPAPQIVVVAPVSPLPPPPPPMPPPPGPEFGPQGGRPPGPQGPPPHPPRR